MAVEFRHERLAKAHDLSLGFSLRVKVGAAFRATHRQACQTVLERLLEGKEFEDAQCDVFVEPEPPLVGPDRTVPLHPVAAVRPDLSLVVLPSNAEDDDSIGLG